MLMNVEMEECGRDFKIQDVPIIVSLSTAALPTETQEITRRIFFISTQSQVLYKGSSCGIYGGQSGNVTVQYFDFPLSLIIPPVTLFTSIHMTQTLYKSTY
jgi:hypothetical protein